MEQLSPFQAHQCSDRFTGRLRHKSHARYGRDTGEGLPTKAQGMDIEEILSRHQFARRVPGESQLYLVCWYTLAVVSHPHKPSATLSNLHTDSGRPGINGVLHQLLHHGSWPLHHFPRGDFRCHIRRQDSNTHIFPPSFLNPIT